MSRPIVLFLGPCYKLDRRTARPYPPFSEASRSGRFLRQAIAEATPVGALEVRFSNILPGPAVGSDGREFNPTWNALVPAALDHDLWRMSPEDLVIGLSAAVDKALCVAAARRVQLGRTNGPRLAALSHPSFIMRRPKPERDQYVDALRERLATWPGPVAGTA